jgi:hypothetical protein
MTVNLFLGIVSQQQAKIEGLRNSGMTSMRAYINGAQGHERHVVPPVRRYRRGAALAVAGGAAADDLAPAVARLSERSRR